MRAPLRSASEDLILPLTLYGVGLIIACCGAGPTVPTLAPTLALLYLGVEPHAIDCALAAALIAGCGFRWHGGRFGKPQGASPVRSCRPLYPECACDCRS